ncbi:MAG: di-trans,poly-cis-decaprenylcistransferase [Coxiella sp. RIFCSPHIGHO2_12_FULL_44_14]|nr:MAG: di-trans,poly-cis-decaprenylcistransferase [Coxiella sp. RIFCSPHIGHO2_12_FULL_44_14]
MPRLPRHIAIVMDGNGRWALQRRLPRVAGHRAGAKIVREIVEHCARLKIDVLTLFAFSLENLARPPSEVQFLMSLFFNSLEENTNQLHENNIRLRIVGDHSQFDAKLLQRIQRSEMLTEHNTGLTLVIAINYSGRWDIVRAAQKLAEQVALRQLSPADITQELFQQHLCLADLPTPDLLIRTSGEQRISNFMLWQFAYTEIYFTPILWPDFNKTALDKALEFYQTRQRRFGLTAEQVEAQHA